MKKLFSLLFCLSAIAAAPDMGIRPSSSWVGANLLTAANAATARTALGTLSNQKILEDPNVPFMWFWTYTTNLLYLTYSMDATNSHAVIYSRYGNSTNVCVDMGAGRILDNPITVATGTWDAARITENSDDDGQPVHLYNDGYVTEGHGWGAVSMTIGGGHTLTGADIGKTWKDSNDHYYTLGRIPDSTHVALIAKPGTVSSVDSCYFLPPGASGTLTAASDGTSVAGPADLAYTASAGFGTYTFLPVSKALPTQTWYADGVAITWSPSTQYRAKVLTINQTCDVWDIRAAYTNLINNPGSDWLNWTNLANIPTMFTKTKTINNYSWGEIDFDETITVVTTNPFKLSGGNGGGQTYGIEKDGSWWDSKYPWLWVPGTSSTWASPALFYTTSSQQDHATATWSSASYPPSWAVEYWGTSNSAFTTNGTDYIKWLAFGVDPTYGNGLNSWRATHCSTFSLSITAASTRKVYLACIGDATSTVSPDTHSWRYWRYKGSSASTAALPQDETIAKIPVYSTSGGYWLLYLGWKDNVGYRVVTIPKYLSGLNATLVQSLNCSLLASATEAAGIGVKTTSSPAYMIVKLTYP